MLLVICGKSGSGKDTLANFLSDNLRYEKVLNTTTRPMRIGEKDKVNYNFISDLEFLARVEQGQFLEYTEFNGWRYGTLVRDVEEYLEDDNKVGILVLNPSGVKTLRGMDVDMFVVGVGRTRGDRYDACVERGDDIDEILRRIDADNKDFVGMGEKVDCIVFNIDKIEDMGVYVSKQVGKFLKER